ncbi:MAG: leucine--tRNA ligase, partial [Aquabacterium sp.]|nr:leucine--tRNA ligase [Aquabacterium sp.]
LWVFTTRADTIMGVTFCAVAPEHPLAVHAAAGNAKLQAFIEECKTGGTTEAELATQEKKGQPTGLFVAHPITGEKVEVWVGNYVLMSYGDGAVMGVPAHDERDFAFAKKYGIAIKQVIGVEGETFSTEAWAEWYGDKQRGVTVNSDGINGLAYKDAVNKVAEILIAKGVGEKKTTWRLRDWGISRQRYWGTPIPIIHCHGSGTPGAPSPDACGPVPVPEKDLPVRLPEDVVPDGSGNPLKSRPDFLNVGCPKCGKPAQRETDTMDTFVDSSWYFMRYACADNANAMVDERTNYWMGAGNAAGNRGMDQYIGGIEHAILHLLYARFWTKVMRDLGLVKVDEPFKKLLTQGMVLNHIYSRKTPQGGIEYFWPHEVENTFDANGKITGAKLKSDGSAIEYGGVGTMSKSKNNGVDPQELIDTMGADTARLFTMFASPPEQTLEWNDAGVEGAHRFVKRVWNFGARNVEALKAAGKVVQSELSAEAKALRREVFVVLKQISYDYERMQYNTVASGAMKLLNALEAHKGATPADQAVLREGYGILLRGLYPACPHLTHVLWQDLGYAAQDNMGDLLDAPWPVVIEEALVQDEIELMLQVNGKLRGSIKVSPHADKAAIEAAALASEDFAKFSEGKAPKKVIVVPGRLVNLVV